MPERHEDHALPAVHVLHLLELVARWNVTPEEVLGSTGLTAERLADPRARISAEVLERVIERARTLTGEPALGVYLGLQMRISSHGYLGFAAMTSATVRDALAIAEQFIPTRTSALALRLHVEDDAASLVIEERMPFGSAQDVVVLALLVGIWQIGVALTGKELKGTMDVTFPEPAYAARLYAIASSHTVRFGQPANRLVFDPKILDLPLAMADPAALALAREQCEKELGAIGAAERVSARVRRLMPRAAGGFLSAPEIAKELHVSPRTLKRMLAAEGTTYSALLEEERHARALLLLRSRELTLDDVAERLGYSDTANFARAFRRWTNVTPSAYRGG